MRQFDVVVECKPDKALVLKLLDLPGKSVHHEGDKGRVVNYVASHKNCVGLVDEDPGSAWPGTFKMFEHQGTVSGSEVTHDVAFYRHRAETSCLVVLSPRLEDWMVKSATEADVDLGDYGLPTQARALHRQVNARLTGWDKLLEALMDSPRLTCLKNLMKSCGS